jgi:hypothetical protein
MLTTRNFVVAYSYVTIWFPATLKMDGVHRDALGFVRRCLDCGTVLGGLAELEPEFDQRNVQIIDCLSTVDG